MNVARPFIYALVAGASLLAMTPAHAREIWSKEQANGWYDKQPWLVGANYNPSSAINQLEMWQGDTFDPKRIDQELGWAQAMGMNTMRVYLHNMLWEQDAKGLKQRINQFLEIAARHNIKPMFVLFDSCWDPEPKLGPQHPPIPGVHNSGWVQAPGRARLEDKSQYPKLRAYVEDVVGSFAKDQRILAWDVWNEPSNSGGGNYPQHVGKQKLVEELLDDVFAWARDKNPVQPLTSGVWEHDDWSSMDRLDAIEKIQISQSDVISFHDYSWPETFERRVKQLQGYGRPILCTEYMARGNGSTFDGSMPIGKRHNVAMINWGFVDGKSQTRMPWDSWKKPYTYDEPTIWFHEVLRTDGTPYRKAEVDLIRSLTSAPKGVVPER
ncbi:endo-1,4-beta-xylanase [Sphingomonas cavernae]|uniref:1,4-beta-xylanase n=1 Tax=Sphingomonas cavernae TaxID=2320861 RepID=A0A418WKU0_9SPHN|nr:endo-1,4-beta-xylanase [Sphingomonas cavernae]RJF90630.1 1,4-beta-xylanase [Sphingomonas cavernae]